MVSWWMFEPVLSRNLKRYPYQLLSMRRRLGQVKPLLRSQRWQAVSPAERVAARALAFCGFEPPPPRLIGSASPSRGTGDVNGAWRAPEP